MTVRKLPPVLRPVSRGGTVGSGAGIIVLAVFFLYLLLMAPFCILVGSRTSWRMGWVMSAPLIFLPLALLIGFLVP
ncbi:hypothetical protein ACFYWX_46160 [Streptomyces sp. NPDC002888]|uniref:hypothetical protein n=1 Tax=Streptomyces sp. NPDC002888 TaxID=3364668 RepID=UPI0036765561